MAKDPITRRDTDDNYRDELRKDSDDVHDMTLRVLLQESRSPTEEILVGQGL